MIRALAAAGLWAALALPATAAAAEPAAGYDPDAAVANSQRAIGGQLGDYALTDASGRAVRIADYTGKPLLISLVFTSCYHVCPVTTRRLAAAVAAAREVLDDDSFQVLTVGFDSPRDTPDAMRVFAREQGVGGAGWDFLSASPDTIAGLTRDLGFVYYPSPRGFDHIIQVSVVDRDGIVRAQVYGEMFELPWLVEPLKNLVFNRPASAGHALASLVDRLKIFCTVYDPATGRYRYDYSLFIGMAIGLAALLGVGTWLGREWWSARRRAARS